MSRSREGYIDAPNGQGKAAGDAPEGAPGAWSVASVVRATGVGEHTLRAWERRHQAIVPIRSEAGTRRYRTTDVDRIRLLKRCVDAGRRIGSIAGCSNAELEAMLEPESAPAAAVGLGPLLAAIEALDGEELDRRLGQALAALGSRSFAVEVAVPLMRVVGQRWENGDLDIAAEHLASSCVRNLLGVALRSAPQNPGAPLCLFTTPPEESHELGTLAAAVAAAEAGARVVFLGSELPAEEVAAAAERLGASAAIVGATCVRPSALEAYVDELRQVLPDRTALWVGGAPGVTAGCAPNSDRVFPSIHELEGEIPLLR